MDDIVGGCLGGCLFEILFWPAEWLTDRLWTLHRLEPPLRRFLGGTVLIVLTVLIWVLYIALLIGIPVAIFLVATDQV